MIRFSSADLLYLSLDMPRLGLDLLRHTPIRSASPKNGQVSHWLRTGLLRLGLLWLLRAHLGPDLVRLTKKLISFLLSNETGLIPCPLKPQLYGLLVFKREIG